MLARISQLSDIFADARKMIDRRFGHAAILGDLNTMAHGVARLSPSYCCDRMRFRSLGSDEAVVWEREVLALKDQRYDPQNDGGDRNITSGGGGSSPPVNEQLRRWGLDAASAADAVNPGFACPFPAATTITLDNPTYRWFGVSFMRGKLDWALLRRVRAVRTGVGNDDFALSDHKWLLVEGVLEL